MDNICPVCDEALIDAVQCEICNELVCQTCLEDYPVKPNVTYGGLAEDRTICKHCWNRFKESEDL